jgi:hypothetical protein
VRPACVPCGDSFLPFPSDHSKENLQKSHFLWGKNTQKSYNTPQELAG